MTLLVLLVGVPAPADAITISFTGPGGAVPDNTAAGVTFDIFIVDPRVIDLAGNNDTLTLLNARHQFLVDLTVELTHMGFGASQVAFDRVLTSLNTVCLSSFSGNYSFNSGASPSLRSECDTVGFGPVTSGTYRPTLPNDSTTSPLSNFWNGQAVAGDWRLFISDQNTGSPAGVVMNTDWSWRLDINVQDAATVPEPSTLILFGSGLAAVIWRRHQRARRS
jgi:hypothetical protein